MILAGFDRSDLRMLLNLFRMSLADRFLGSALGLAWALISPLMLMGIFCFVFTFVFPGRLPGRAGALPYVIWLISGYGPWLSLSEGLTSATISVIGNSGIVKNIAFNSELLPMVGSLLGLLPLLVSFVVILALQAVGGEAPNLAWLWLPFATVLQFIFISGIGLFLGALNVFLRDTALILPNLLTLLLFASPIFYPLTAYPAAARNILVFNPFYVLAELYREPILNGALPPLWMIIYFMALAGLLFAAGLWWFRRLKFFFDTRL